MNENGMSIRVDKVREYNGTTFVFVMLDDTYGYWIEVGSTIYIPFKLERLWR